MEPGRPDVPFVKVLIKDDAIDAMDRSSLFPPRTERLLTEPDDRLPPSPLPAAAGNGGNKNDV